jgi:hypothetical protein
MLNCNIENAGLETLIVRMRCPAYRANRLFRALYAALSLEWACRQIKDDTSKPVELPQLDTLTEDELKECASFMYWLCSSIDVERYPRTFAFCFALFVVLVEETNLRSPTEAVTIH